MIFGVRNEDGERTFDLVMKGKKTVTRRLLNGRKYEVYGLYAVQSGRTRKSSGKIKILSRMLHKDWWQERVYPLSDKGKEYILQNEAEREGFKSWDGLMNYFKENEIDPMDLIRYEFVLICKY